MSSAWTPGPWDIAVGGLVLRGGERHGSSGPYTPFRAGAVTISVSGAAAGTPSGYSPIVSVSYSDRPGDRGIANARLIAAAPDLAEALEALVADWDATVAGFADEDGNAPVASEVEPPLIAAARLALSKARGETE